MNLFRTPIDINKQPFSLNHTNCLLFFGSCFAETIGNMLKQNKFDITVNPFGILYNPVSVAQSIDLLLKNQPFTQTDIDFHNEQWCSFYHHGRFSDSSKDNCLSKINNELIIGFEKLQRADYLFITFGTSWMYYYAKRGIVVANNHKLPASCFTRTMISVSEIVELYARIIKKLLQINHNLRIVFTISPVRHWKDGAHGNQLSKSTLLLAVDQLEKMFDSVSYFPSYEIVLDELRDYRFFEDDMLHPNKTATNYVFDKFAQMYFEPQTISLNKKIDKIRLAYAHRPFNIASEAHKKFASTTLRQIDEILKIEASLCFDLERSYFKSILSLE